MQRFEGKVAVVTGSSGGIGAAMSEALLKNNLTVVGLDLDIEKLQVFSLFFLNSKFQFSYATAQVLSAEN